MVIVDWNGLEADGPVQELTGLGNIAEKYRVFGWNVMEIDGNDITEIKKAFDELPDPGSTVPTAILAHTVKGKGVSFMEHKLQWHTGKVTDEQLQQSIAELTAAYERKWAV